MPMSIRSRSLFLIVTLAGLTSVLPPARAQMPPQDLGATGAWQKLLKLRTTASAMHTTAHPDDEHGGVLAMLSRGQGARVSLLTLTRGESGDNAIGPELFDGLGLIRTEELLVADRYYGVDRQYFGTVADYGFSKRLDEALEKWGKEHVLRDVVGIIRTERPFVLIARFQGNQRDGHGNHSAAGLVTQEAFKMAGDPTVFPEQIAAGLRPWQPLKLYMGGVRENEDWTIRVDAGEYDPVLGDSYQSFARLGLSFQRSQNSGRFSGQPGPAVSYYKRLQSLVDAPAKEKTFFDGIDTAVPGLYRALRTTAPPAADGLLSAIDREIRSAFDSFSFTDPSAAGPALARALSATRAALEELGGDPDVEVHARLEGTADRRRDARRAGHQPDRHRAASRHAGGDRAVQRRPARDARDRPRPDLRGSRRVHQPRPVGGDGSALRGRGQRHQIGVGGPHGRDARGGRSEQAD